MKYAQRLNLSMSLAELEEQQECHRVKTKKPARQDTSRDAKRSKTREKDFSNQRALKRNYE